MKWLTRIFLVTLVVVGLLYTYLAALDVNQYNAEIVNYVSTQTGRAFSIDGDIGIKLALVPTIKIEGVTFGNADRAAHETLATAQRIEAELALLPLLYGQLSIKRFAIVNARVSVEIDRRGRGNWILAQREGASGDLSPFELPEFDFKKISIKESVVEYRRHDKPAEEITLDELRINSNGFGQAIALAVRGSYQQHPFKFQGQLSPLNRLVGNEPYALDLKGSIDTIEISVSGEIEQPLDGKGIDLALEVHIPELADIATMLDLDLPQSGPVDVSSALTDTKSGYAFNAAKIVTQGGDWVPIWRSSAQ